MPHGESTDRYLPLNGLHTERDEVRDEQKTSSVHARMAAARISELALSSGIQSQASAGVMYRLLLAREKSHWCVRLRTRTQGCGAGRPTTRGASACVQGRRRRQRRGGRRCAAGASESVRATKPWEGGVCVRQRVHSQEWVYARWRLGGRRWGGGMSAARQRDHARRQAARPEQACVRARRVPAQLQRIWAGG
jgi:hypothetical protein